MPGRLSPGLWLSHTLLCCLSHLGWPSHHFKSVIVTPSFYPGSQGYCWTRQTIPWTLAPSHSCLSCLSHTLAPEQYCFRSVIISVSQLYRWREVGVRCVNWLIVIVGDAIDVFCYGLGHNKEKTMTRQMLHKICRPTTPYHQEVGDLTLPVQGS